MKIYEVFFSLGSSYHNWNVNSKFNVAIRNKNDIIKVCHFLAFHYALFQFYKTFQVYDKKQISSR